MEDDEGVQANTENGRERGDAKAKLSQLPVGNDIIYNDSYYRCAGCDQPHYDDEGMDYPEPLLCFCGVGF